MSSTPRSKFITVAGSIAQRPHKGGHAWVFLQYLLGFRRLGLDVLFLDRLEPEMCFDSQGRPCSTEESENLLYLRQVMESFSLGDSYALLYDGGERSIGLSRHGILERVAQSAFILNVMGFLNDEEILAAAPMRVFLDIDPGFGQMWRDLGLHDLFIGHDRFVTIGENVGRANCSIPTCGIDWITTPQPVVLDHWAAEDSLKGDWFTGVGSWRGPYGPIEYEGRTYGLRVHEFRKFIALPGLTGQGFQLALDIHPAEVRDLTLLAEHGWSLVDPRVVGGDPWAYQDYIFTSRAEFMVAKNIYVQSNSGWFSDRTICYLAAGKPALVQDTGLADLYPSGEGLITFTNLEEAAAGVEAINRDYSRHARAARSIAEKYFDSDKVLSVLLEKLGVAN